MKAYTRIKICCISSKKEADMAIRFGANALGLVGKMSSGQGVISDEHIAQITSQVPPTVSTFLLTSEIRGRIDHSASSEGNYNNDSIGRPSETRK